MDRMVVIGGGGHAKVLICVLKKSGYDIAGYTDRQDKGLILGAPYLGDDGILAEMIRKDAGCRAVIGIGKIDTSDLRFRLQNELLALGYGFPPVVSPHAVVNEEVRLGAGTAVLDGVVVNSGSHIGRACIINTNSTVEHDCRIGDNVHIAPGATLSGGVVIGANSMIGTGTTVIQGVAIGADCLVGAGSTVVKDITTPGIYAGSPARKIR